MPIKNFRTFLLTHIAAFNNSPAWKLGEDGKGVLLKDGNPVFIDREGQEKTISLDTIGNLNREAKTHREAKEAAEARLKDFEGLDAKAAREAIDKLSRIDQNKLIDSGKVDEVKAEITKQFQNTISEKDTAFQELQGKYDNTLINNTFANSEFIRNNVAVPRDMFEATFRENFRVEKGEVVVYGKDGNRLFSKDRHGEYATPEEGLRILAESHPQKAAILKAETGNGSGSNGGGGNHGGGRTIKRPDFEKLNPTQQAEYSLKISKGEMNLVD